jgi:LuxR family maltose regulon positive regulatory protein
MAQKNDSATDITLSLLSSRNGAGLTFDHKAEVIDLLDRHSDEELGQNLAAVIVLIRLMISFDETRLFDRCVSVFEKCIGDYSGEDKNHLLMNFERFIGLSKYNNIAEMTEHFRKSLTYLDSPFTGEERVGNWTFGSPSVLLMFHRESGGLAEELEHMREGMPVYCKLTDGHGYGAELVMEAEAAYNAGRFTEAETIVHKAWYFAREKDQWSILLTAVFLRMRLLLTQGDWFEVLNIRQLTAEMMERRNLLLLQHTLDMCQSYIHLMLDMPDKVTEWITEGDASISRVMYPAKPALNIIYGRYLLSIGEYTKLLGIAEAARETASKNPNLLGVIYLDIYLAAANAALSREDKAIACIESALGIALPDNILMPFAENAGFIMDILTRLASDERYAESIVRIMELYWGFEKTRAKILREHFSQSDSLSSHEIAFGALRLEILSGRAYLNGDDLLLGPKEFSLLFALAQNEGRIISAEQLYQKVWNAPIGNDKNALQNRISAIRKKLEEKNYDYTISSVYGKGYCFEKS